MLKKTKMANKKIILILIIITAVIIIFNFIINNCFIRESIKIKFKEILASEATFRKGIIIVEFYKNTKYTEAVEFLNSFGFNSYNKGDEFIWANDWSYITLKVPENEEIKWFCKLKENKKIKSVDFDYWFEVDIYPMNLPPDNDIAIQTCEQRCDQAKVLPKDVRTLSPYCKSYFEIDSKIVHCYDSKLNVPCLIEIEGEKKQLEC